MLFKKIKHAFEEHKEHFMTLFFFLGFIVDNLTLNRIDQLFDDVILFFYVVLGMVSMLFLYAASANKLPERMNAKMRDYSSVAMQYAFGSLFSGMLIFYGRSGAWLVSWPFLLVILIVIFGNETIKDRVQRLLYNVAMLFVGLFSFMVLIVPVLIKQMSDMIFVGSGIAALCIMLMYLKVLEWVIPRFMALHKKAILFVVWLIFIGFNGLYFANLIPPIPLSLTEIGIFHNVAKLENNTYQLTYEKGPWWQFYHHSDSVIYPKEGQNIYCFAKVFAPTQLNTEIYHRWEYYDVTKKQWVQHSRVSYPIQGGNSGGYRGYSYIEAFTDGTWRCSVETERGQVLGREVFTVDSKHTTGELTERIE